MKNLKILKKLSREFIILIGLISISGSLAASEIFGWKTFTLSTVQRIFMYPIPIITATAMYIGKNNLRKLVLPLSFLGIISSATHFFIVLVDPTRGCGFALPCTAGLRYTIGNLSIRPFYLPGLALSAFMIIIAIVIKYEPVNQ